MKRLLINKYIKLLFTGFIILSSLSANAQDVKEETALDKKVKAFLDSHQRQWYDMNIPAVDGKLMYDIIIENGYTSALEIGTSTGRSGIWIAWALSKTGGKLITIDIDEHRHRIARENFEKAGLSEYIDARLGDAHDLVPKLKGPFDFVFSDADKSWYKNYFMAIDPKLEVGGCFTTHNVTGYGRGGNRDYLEYLKSLPNYDTTVNYDGGGMAVSYKKAEK